MKFKYYLVLVIFILVSNVYAQTTQKDVLFTVGGEPVYTSEFIRVYNKNLDLVQDESQKNIDDYLDLYVNYKPKLMFNITGSLCMFIV